MQEFLPALIGDYVWMMMMMMMNMMVMMMLMIMITMLSLAQAFLSASTGDHRVLWMIIMKRRIMLIKNM